MLCENWIVWNSHVMFEINSDKALNAGGILCTHILYMILMYIIYVYDVSIQSHNKCIIQDKTQKFNSNF